MLIFIAPNRIKLGQIGITVITGQPRFCVTVETILIMSACINITTVILIIVVDSIF